MAAQRHLLVDTIVMLARRLLDILVNLLIANRSHDHQFQGGADTATIHEVIHSDLLRNMDLRVELQTS